MTKNWFYADGVVPVCNDCLKQHFNETNWSWDSIDSFCRNIDIPFIPREFEKLKNEHGEEVLPIYAKYFHSVEYDSLGWKDYNQKYEELKAKKKLDLELPLVNETYLKDLQLRWGASYNHEELIYLENLYNGLLNTQNINGAVQTDQAQKLCKMSLTIDQRIMQDLDFDKLMSSYDKMIKVANLTPKNSKSDADLSSMGEVVAWEEKRGWLNPWYTDANKDIVDEILHSMQGFVRRLYTHESGLGEEIDERLQQLKIAAEADRQDKELETKKLKDDPFFTMEEVDLDSRDNDAYEELFIEDAVDDMQEV